MHRFVYDRQRRVRNCYLAITIVLCATVIGCRAAPKSVTTTDTRVRRLSEDARELYAEGDLNTAIAKYQAALLRAWAMDDPVESGSIAYNLAACLTSNDQSELARDWLADARYELQRGEHSTGNAWLLEAKIATRDARFEDAQRFLDHSACIAPPCEVGDDECGCPTANGCNDCALNKVPCIGKKILGKEAMKDCQQSFEAQIHLARARLAAERYEVGEAAKHFNCACELADSICSYELHAELHDVAGWIHVAKSEFVQAAWHFDKEAKHLRLSGNYGEITSALDSSASAFENGGMSIEAAERWNRVARIWLGRGDPAKAWEYLRMASEAVEACEFPLDNSLRIRLSLVAREIEFVASERSKP